VLDTSALVAMVLSEPLESALLEVNRGESKRMIAAVSVLDICGHRHHRLGV
jgi:uncharacterized protein with PIN domain